MSPTSAESAGSAVATPGGHGRVVPLDVLPALLEEERAAGRRIVLTNGCFDLLHVGHVRNLAACRALGDVLVVGVNGDESVRRLKGAGRPLVPADERAELLSALRVVDYVTIFPEVTAERLVEVVRPDVYAKGADYAHSGGDGASPAPGWDEARLPEARVVRRHGGRVALLPVTPGRSTTSLVEQIVRAAALPLPLRGAARMAGEGPRRRAQGTTAGPHPAAHDVDSRLPEGEGA